MTIHKLESWEMAPLGTLRICTFFEPKYTSTRNLEFILSHGVLGAFSTSVFLLVSIIHFRIYLTVPWSYVTIRIPKC